VAAGPQEILSAVSGGSGNFQFVTVSGNSSLTYERRRGGISFTYMRGLTGGSGIFQGAVTDTFSTTAHYQFTRFWMGSVTAGYALNKSLPSAGVAAMRFDNWFLGANLGRRLGPRTLFNLNYGLQRQNSPSVCPAPSCGLFGFQQTIGMTVNWHLRPTG
jgi:hypothetical protein